MDVETVIQNWNRYEYKTRCPRCSSEWTFHWHRPDTTDFGEIVLDCPVCWGEYMCGTEPVYVRDLKGGK